MKKINILTVLFLSLLVWGCYTGDDYNSYISLKVEDPLTIENKTNYVVGDTLYFELQFSRYLPEEGYSNLLDIYESTQAEEFRYSFGLGKYSSFSNNYDNVNIAFDYLFAEKGSVFRDYNNEAYAVLNTEKTLYESRVGIILAEAGEYRLNFGYLNLNSINSADHVTIGIESTKVKDTLSTDFVVTQ